MQCKTMAPAIEQSGQVIWQSSIEGTVHQQLHGTVTPQQTRRFLLWHKHHLPVWYFAAMYGASSQLSLMLILG